MVLGPQRLAATEAVELRGRDQDGRRVESEAIGDIGLQRLAGLRAIGDAGVERVQREPRSIENLRPLVRVDEIARVGLREAWRAGREDVLQPVENLEPACGAAGVFDLAASHEAESVAGQPGVAKGELQLVIDLLEAQRVSGNALVEVAAGLEYAILLAVERLPDADLPLRFDADQGPRPGVQAALVDLVDGDVREERRIGRDPTCGETAGGRDEQPVIPARNDADQERRHPVDVADGVEALAANVDEFPGHAVRHGAGDSRGCVHGVKRLFNLPVPAPRTGRRRSSRGPWGRAGPIRTR